MRQNDPRRISRFLAASAIWAAVGLGIATSLALFASHAWWADLFAHFRPHYVIAATLLIVFAATTGRRMLGLAALALAIANALPLLPFVSAGAAASTAAPAFKVVFLNLWNRNFDVEPAIEFLHREDPDIVLLAEVAPHWSAALGSIRSRYPYRIENFECKQYINCQMAIYSRRPWTKAGIEPAGDPMPLAWVRFEDGPRTVTLVATHLISGLLPAWAPRRRAQFESLASFLAGIDGAVVLAGDFNTTPWSADFSKLAPAAGLVHVGPRLAATWPTPLGPLGIPIDHVFVARGAEATDVGRGPAVGSDHYPIVFRVGLSR